MVLDDIELVQVILDFQLSRNRESAVAVYLIVPKQLAEAHSFFYLVVVRNNSHILVMQKLLCCPNFV